MNDMRKLLNIMEGSYSRELEKNDYTVSQMEYNGHRNLLEKLVPLVKSLKELSHELYATDKIDNAESELLQEATRLLQTIMVPMALLNVREEPKLKLPKL